MSASGAQGGPYIDRVEAGDALATEFTAYQDRADVVVLGLPRGGVPVAARVAKALDAPLDVLVVRKLGLPSHSELAMSAVAGVGTNVEVVRNDRVIDRAGIDAATFQQVLERETDELRRRECSYRGDRPPEEVRGRTVIVVDDGLATGATMRAAVSALRRRDPARVVVAAPIASGATCQALAREADKVVCLWTPAEFVAVGQGYRDFRPTTHDDVLQLLASYSTGG